MVAAIDIWNRVLGSIVHEERKPRRPIAVPDGAAPKPPIEPQKDYVGIRVNQLFLHDARKWFTTIEPAVYASTEFIYGGGIRTDPFVVAPKKADALSAGTVMKDIGVFGPHPHRGGKLTYSIVLAQMPMKNVARDLLDIVESTGKALDATASLATWTNISGVVLDGFNRLMGLSEVRPVIGVRQEHDADADGRLPTGHYVLIDADVPDPSKFWVRDGMLMRGPSLETATPYRDTDFVLYEIFKSEGGRRTDVDRLPFKALWDRAIEAAGKPGADAWDEAKANMAALASALYRSPDLTFDQASELRANYVAVLCAVHEEAKKLALLSDKLAEPSADVGDILRLT